jgi:hypothetical protein
MGRGNLVTMGLASSFWDFWGLVDYPWAGDDVVKGEFRQSDPLVSEFLML